MDTKNSKLMKFMRTLLLFLLCGIASAADLPKFYVLDIHHTGEAVLHTNTEQIPKTDQRYVLADTAKIDCCFRFGTKPGMGKPTIKIDDDAPPLTSSKGEEIYQFPGYLTAKPASRKRGDGDTLAFGVIGMADVAAKGKNTYEVTFSDDRKPVYVRQCLGVEGVNFRIYHTLDDKKPYVTYYFALGYDTKPDCR